MKVFVVPGILALLVLANTAAAATIDLSWVVKTYEPLNIALGDKVVCGT
jgi:hypothetical protein